MDNTPFSLSSGFDDTLPEELQAISRAYAAQPVPRPSQAETTALMQHLLAEAPFITQEKQRREYTSFRYIFTVTRWRVFLLGPWFWIMGVLVVFIAGCTVWKSQGPSSMLQAGTPIQPDINSLVMFLVLLLPLGAVMGLAYALRTPSAGLRAVEVSCPVNFVQTMMSMALIVLAFDCFLGLLITLGLTLIYWVPFWNLLLAWMAPLLVLAAISLPLALLYNVRVAMVIGGLPWLLLGFVALAQQNIPNTVIWFFSLPQDTLSLSSHLILVVLSLVVLVVLFFSAPRWQRFCTF